MPTNNGTENFSLEEIALRTGQTPREIVGAGRLEGEYFPTGQGTGADLLEEISELYNMVEDYVITQQALINVLTQKGTLRQEEIDEAIRTLLEQDDKDIF